jgi:hypothetical protein
MFIVTAIAKTRLLSVAMFCSAIALPAVAQTPAPSFSTKPPAAAEPQPGEIGPFVNVRVDLTILDQGGSGQVARKTVSMYIADQSGANVRTTGRMLTREGWRDVSITVDARPTVIRGRSDAVRLDLGLEYRQLPSPSTGAAAVANAQSDEMSKQPTTLNQKVVTILDSGKPIVISQAADPSSDRSISVELKATIQK